MRKLCAVLAMFAVGAGLPVGAAQAGGLPPDAADVVAKLLPEVVNISVVKYTPPKNDPHSKNLAAYDKDLISGSGFVVDPSGVIVTNAHVVEGASEIIVIFQDMTRRRAKLIYRSPIDMVLLKVNADAPLPAVTWGDSETMRPGDSVIAIGNPLGIGTTVTAGIVSALDRDIQETPYDAFIQIDASINHGNSGGPLFNTAGQVIGINTALYAPGGQTGSVGLGFAIPGNDAQFVLDEVRKYGRVRQGWLGADVQPISYDLGDSLGLTPPRGVIIDSVVPGSPAAKAGLSAADVILKIGDADMRNPRDYNRAVAKAPFDSTQQLTLWRNGAQTTLTIPWAESPNSQPASMDMQAMSAPLKPATPGDMGVTLATVTPALRSRFKLTPTQSGVVVTNVVRNSLADNQGVQTGDVVIRAGTQTIHSDAELKQAVADAVARKQHHLLVMLQEPAGTVRFIGVPLAVMEGGAG